MSPRPRFSLDRPLLILDVVGMRETDLGDAPNMARFAGRGQHGPLRTICPAVTCSVQASILTGTLPNEHGIVGNGWYFRDLAQILFWRQSNALVQRKAIYDYGLENDPGFTCAKMFWWFNMYSSASTSVTPRPQYFANGLKTPGLYGEPRSFVTRLERELGPFPLFQFWGPAAGIASSRWIADATLKALEDRPRICLCYLPHLDYDHQRHGPDHPKSRQAVRDVDSLVGRVLDAAENLGYETLIVSEYGIDDVQTPVWLNRVLRQRGLLRVQETMHGELLDAGASDAFAVCDHQVAHVYVRRESQLPLVRATIEEMPGVARVLDREEQREFGLDHERSGELVVLAEQSAWFAYHYWFDEKRRPDFATTVDIHRKPGYDPVELFLDPAIRLPKLKIARRILQKKLGFRYLMDVISTDATLVRGSHGLLPSRPERGPLYLASPGLKLPVDVRVDNLLFE
ncbi:MAG: alkaline phosphatase family protein [Planctomycetes bacterium]|nr:alkaline phosphatase family protein [Planctomycetota bacterium]MCB9919572.1 alkaline phosphatase family protein [Planctomycetota bacterium]